MLKQPESYVAKSYSLETYKATYSRSLQPVSGSTFWEHRGEGMVLPLEIERNPPGRRKTARRRDADEPRKKKKYCRSGMPTKCSNCGAIDHDKRKCTNPPVASTRRTTTTTTGRGRPKGSKNRIGNDEAPPLAQYLARNNQRVGPVVHPSEAASASASTWLHSVGRGKGSGRNPPGRGWGRGRGSGAPIGIGISYGDGGEITYLVSTTSPGIVVREPQRQPTQASGAGQPPQT